MKRYSETIKKTAGILLFTAAVIMCAACNPASGTEVSKEPVSKSSAVSADASVKDSREVRKVTVRGGVNEEGETLNDQEVEFYEGDTWADVAARNTKLYQKENDKLGKYIVLYPDGGYNCGFVSADKKLVRPEETVDPAKNYYLRIDG